MAATEPCEDVLQQLGLILMINSESPPMSFNEDDKRPFVATYVNVGATKEILKNYLNKYHRHQNSVSETRYI